MPAVTHDQTIAFLPNCSFLSEVSRAVGIARAVVTRGVPVAFAARGGPYAHLIEEAGFDLHRLDPPAHPDSDQRFLDALLSMGPRVDTEFYTDDELRAAVAAEHSFLQDSGAAAAVTGFTLTAYLSTRLAALPLITDHGGSFVPPVMAAGLCPLPTAWPDPKMAKAPVRLQRLVANRASAFIRSPSAQLNRHATELGVPTVPGLNGLMCGDLTLVTDLPEVVGLSAEALEQWQPRWPFRVRPGTTFRFTGPLFAQLDLPVPPEVDAFLSTGEPVVFVSPTTVSQPFLRAMVSQAKQAGARVLVGATVHDVADLADDRTVIAGVLPNHRIMPRVAAAVIMGGQGSVQTAMAAGTPFVGLPYHPEQELNVAVAERLGMAIRMAPGAAGTAALPRSILRLLDEPSFATSAASAARHYAGVDGADRAAATIVAWLAERKPAAPTRMAVLRPSSS